MTKQIEIDNHDFEIEYFLTPVHIITGAYGWNERNEVVEMEIDSISLVYGNKKRELKDVKSDLYNKIWSEL